LELLEDDGALEVYIKPYVEETAKAFPRYFAFMPLFRQKFTLQHDFEFCDALQFVIHGIKAEIDVDRLPPGLVVNSEAVGLYVITEEESRIRESCMTLTVDVTFVCTGGSTKRTKISFLLMISVEQIRTSTTWKEAVETFIFVPARQKIDSHFAGNVSYYRDIWNKL
jgi:hypothetical protein